MTLNQLIILFKDIAARHEQVNDFAAVQDFNIGADNAPDFPILVVNPTGANLPRTDNGYSSFITTFDLQVIDLVNKDNNNELEVLSDAQQILNDIVNEFNTHPYYIDSGIDTIGNIDFEPLRGVYTSDVDGWKISIELESPNKISFCSNPITNLSGFDFSPASVSIMDNGTSFELYPSDSYTCTAVVDQEGIAYQRNYTTRQVTSYTIYDDAYNMANGVYDYTELPNPLYIQRLDLDVDSSGKTLLKNNFWGNKIRFTDVNGNASLDTNGVYFVDNFTGLGHWASNTYIDSYNDMLGVGGVIEGLNTANFQGYNDWFIPNITILNDITTYEDFNIINKFIVPYYNTYQPQLGSSTSYDANSNYIISFSEGQNALHPKQNNKTNIITRLHFK